MAEQIKTILERGGTKIAPAAGGARRYRKLLKSFRWCDIKSILSDSFSEWSRHKAPRLGASLAFYTLLSVTPLFLAAISIAGLVFGARAAESDLVQQVQSLVGSARALALPALLERSRNTQHTPL